MECAVPEYDLDDEFADETESGKDPVRTRLRELEKQNKKLEQAVAEANKRLSDYQVRDVLSERGLSDKRIPRWLKADGVDVADSAAVDAWLNENGELFGYQKPAPPTEQEQHDRQAGERMAAVEAQGITATRQQEILQEIAGAQTPEELDRIRAKYADVKLTS